MCCIFHSRVQKEREGIAEIRNKPAFHGGSAPGGAVVLSHVFFIARMFQAIDVGVAVPEGEKETKAAVYFHGVYSVFGKGMQGAVFLLSANVLMVLCVLRRVHSFGIPAGMGCAAWTVSAAEFSAQILCGIVFRACSVKERLLLGLQIFPAFFSQR